MKTRKLKYKWSVSAVPWINFYFFTVTCMSCVTQYLSSTSLTTESVFLGFCSFSLFQSFEHKNPSVFCFPHCSAFLECALIWVSAPQLSSHLLHHSLPAEAAVGSCRRTARNSLMPFLTHFSLVPQLRRAWVSLAAFTLTSYLFRKFSSYINRHKTWGERSTVHQ